MPRPEYVSGFPTRDASHYIEDADGGRPGLARLVAGVLKGSGLGRVTLTPAHVRNGDERRADVRLTFLLRNTADDLHICRTSPRAHCSTFDPLTTHGGVIRNPETRSTSLVPEKIDKLDNNVERYRQLYMNVYRVSRYTITLDLNLKKLQGFAASLHRWRPRLRRADWRESC